MPSTTEQFDRQLASIRERITDQGQLVTEICEQSFQSIYDMASDEALALIGRDDEVDRNDIDIERDTVELLFRATHDGESIGEAQVRSVLTCVKANNELERIADAAVSIATRVVTLGDRASNFPRTTEVMTNSVVGILRDTVRCFGDTDAGRAKLVLSAEGAVLEFYDLVVRKTEERIADGRMAVDHAFELHSIIHQAVLMADHCTNIAEQVIYEATGTIVRHTDAGWVEQDMGERDDAD